jgi:hypothetical protein
MRTVFLVIAFFAFLTGCATDDTSGLANSVSPASSGLPPDTGLTGVGGTGTGGTGQAGTGISNIGIDRQRTTGTGALTNRIDRP